MFVKSRMSIANTASFSRGELPSGKYQTTWAFVLEEPQPGRTRLLVRPRRIWLSSLRIAAMGRWRVTPIAHFIMQRKQLLGIARRVEAYHGR